MDKGNQYVFVCCGTREHVSTLHVALTTLRAKTKFPIVVVTDSKRNEIPISHDRIVDVSTDENLTHHQASIWLKTSLHRLLPKDNIYAYLDTDVLAIGTNPDAIFNEYISPIRFAADHCRLMQFSPYSVNCGCLKENEILREKINVLIAEADPYSSSNNVDLQSRRKELQADFHAINSNILKRGITALRFLMASKTFHLNPRFYYNKREKTWYSKVENLPIMAQVDMKKIARKEGLYWNIVNNQIQKADGKSIWQDNCTHLAEQIKNKFSVTVSEDNWQHWNGGVFLFDENSAEFMETWHKNTLSIFSDNVWKTRDQGTMVATVWQLGLQYQKVLDKKWNYIADYFNPNLKISEDGSQLTLDGETFEMPEFIHVYHHFGDKTWNIWNWVEKQIEHYK